MLSEEQIKTLKAAPFNLSVQEYIDLVYPDAKIDPRTKEGREVREFLVKSNIKYTTKLSNKTDSINFSEPQKQLIISEAKRGVSSFDIAKQVFENDEIIKNGLEHKAILMFIRNSPNDEIEDHKSAGAYSPYKSIGRLLLRVNSCTGMTLAEDKLDKASKVRLERLLVNLSGSRVVTIANNYKREKNRDLFIDEFIRMTWDKPDLSADELNLYISISKDIVSLEEISKHLEKLNEFFDDINDAGEATIKLSDMIKSKSDEQSKIETRIRTVTQMMNQNRSKRMEEKNKRSASFLAIVQAFQEEDERALMIKMAEMRNAVVKKGLDELEDMAEWRARILGIEKEDIV